MKNFDVLLFKGELYVYGCSRQEWRVVGSEQARVYSEAAEHDRRMVFEAAVPVCSECMFVDGVCWIMCRASPIAQLVERAAVNLKVAGSNPAGRAPFTPTTGNQS